MATQVVCDGCGEVLDTSQPYYQAVVTQVQVNQDGAVVTVVPAQSLDYHLEHLPVPHAVSITELLPNMVSEDAGNDNQQVNVNGIGFTLESKVVFGGQELATAFKSPTQLSFTIDASPTGKGDGEYQVLVRNVDGSESNTLPFTIQPGA